MINKQFVIAGTGLPELIDLARDVCDEDSAYRFLGFIDDNPENLSRELYGHEILGGFEFVSRYRDVKVVNGIARNARIRKSAHDRLCGFGANFINLIHPTVFERAEDLGIGNIIDRYSIIHRGSRIGNYNLLLTNVIIGHDTFVGSLNFFGHNVIINGHVQIRDECFLAAGSVVAPQIVIAENVTLGFGVVVTDNLSRGVTLLNRPPMLHRP